MKKTKLLLIIAIVLIVGFGIYKYFPGDSKFNATGSVDAARISILAAETNDPSLCKKIKLSHFSEYGSQSDLIAECFYRLAAYTQNKAMCEYISDIASVSSYKESCYRESTSGTSPILCQKFQYANSKEWLPCMDRLQQKWIDQATEASSTKIQN